MKSILFPSNTILMLLVLGLVLLKLHFNVLSLSYTSISCIQFSSTHVSWILLICFFPSFFIMVTVKDVKNQHHEVAAITSKLQQKGTSKWLFVFLCSSWYLRYWLLVTSLLYSSCQQFFFLAYSSVLFLFTGRCWKIKRWP